MTIIEMFPWLVALFVTLVTANSLTRNGVPNIWALCVGLVSGTVSWLLVVIGGQRLVSRLDQKRQEKEKSDIERRIYQTYDPARQYPPDKNLFYECSVCGNALASLPKKDAACRCRNILIDAGSGTVKIRDEAKVKLFTFRL